MNHVYDILEVIKDELRATKGVNTVSFGDIAEADLDKTTIFPLSHIILGNANHRGNVIEFDLKILMCDIVDHNNKKTDDDEFYGNDNMQDVLNTQFEVGNRLISKLRRGDLFRQQYRVVSDTILEPFVDRFSNLLAGYELNITIQVKNDMSIC